MPWVGLQSDIVVFLDHTHLLFVCNCFQAILKFWLEKGVDGFNIRDSSFLYEDFDLRDEPSLNGASPTSVCAQTFTFCILVIPK